MTSRFERDNVDDFIASEMQNIPGAGDDGIGETNTAGASTRPSMRP